MSYSYIPFSQLYIEQDFNKEGIFMKRYIVIIAFLVLIIFILGFARCSSMGVSGSAQSDETTGGAVDMSPIPANSEFLNE